MGNKLVLWACIALFAWSLSLAGCKQPAPPATAGNKSAAGGTGAGDASGPQGEQARGTSPVSMPAAKASFFPTGKYTGRLTIEKLNACEEFKFHGLNRPPGDSTTDAFLTVTDHGTTLILEYDTGNTKAADYFETEKGSLLLAQGHMTGGVRHQSLYYFEMTFTHDAATDAYAGNGTWIIQDECESKAPGYHARLTLSPVKS